MAEAFRLAHQGTSSKRLSAGQSGKKHFAGRSTQAFGFDKIILTSIVLPTLQC